MKRPFILILITLSCLAACRNGEEKQAARKKPGKNELVTINKYFVQKDRENIQNYISRKNLPMKESQSGLWYYIIKEGSGKLFGNRDRVAFDYTCSLLDGTICYSSKTLGQKVCVLGKSEIESGLYEGLRMLRPGGEAIFILPPFLAYGLLGDGKSIPPREVIIYHITIGN